MNAKNWSNTNNDKTTLPDVYEGSATRLPSISDMQTQAFKLHVQLQLIKGRTKLGEL